MVVIAIAFILFIDPFNLFSGRRAPRFRVSAAARVEMAEFINSAGTPADAILDALSQADVVFIGETGFIKDHVEVVSGIIEPLDTAGIRTFGYQYALIDDQGLLDDLVTGPSFDEALAREILFNQLTVFGWVEHVDLLRKVWEVNRRKSDPDEPFRVIALANRLDYSALVKQDDVENPEAMARVFATGVTDVVMADRIRTEFLEPGLKGVVYVQIDNALTDFTVAGYSEQLENLGFPGVKRVGNSLHDQYGSRVATAILHGPVPVTGSRTGLGYLTGGAIDRVLAVATADRAVGFQVAGSPFGGLRVAGNIATTEDNTVPLLEAFTDVYITVGPVKQLTTITPIDNFITDANLQEAIRRFPGPDPGDVSAAEMIDFIAGTASQVADAISRIR